VKKGSASFFEKKEAKKLSFTVGVGAGGARARSERGFFCFFFFKKRSACLLGLGAWVVGCASLTHPTALKVVRL
jgi:hypothetical protein